MEKRASKFVPTPETPKTPAVTENLGVKKPVVNSRIQGTIEVIEAMKAADAAARTGANGGSSFVSAVGVEEPKKVQDAGGPSAIPSGHVPSGPLKL